MVDTEALLSAGAGTFFGNVGVALALGFASKQFVI